MKINYNNLLAYAALSLLILPCPASGQDNPPLQVFLNQSKTPLTGPKIIIPHDAGQVRFLIWPVPGIVRYRLWGYDNWSQRQGQMFVGIRFYNKGGDFLDEISFLKNGRSNGWGGSLETSVFDSKEEKIQVPPQTAMAELFLTSAGPPSSVGVLSITDFDLYQNNTPLHLDNGWTKAGTRPSMAFAKKIGGHDALIIDDNDIKSHTDWHSARKPVEHGENFALRWKEIYSNGIGDPMTAFYGRLPIGSYKFEVQETDLAGNTARSYSVDILVPAPFWKTWWFWTLCFAATVALGITGGFLWSRANEHLRLEKARMIEEERRRISRDLHDELGARISQISLASSYAEGLAADPKIRDRFRSITGLAQELSISLTEAIWMLNSKNDHLESLIEFLCRLVSSLCKPSGIRCRIEADTFEGHLALGSDFRRHVSLSVREALNNALRHSNASELRFLLKIKDAQLIIRIMDNGTGIPENTPKGNGLANMRQRIAALHGQFQVEIPEGGGACITFKIPMPATTQTP
jgi:signal transduction histidine kinase